MLALLLTVVADRLDRRHGVPRIRTPTVLVVAAVLVAVALPWLAAVLGFYVDQAPLLGRIYLAGESVPRRVPRI